MSLKCPDNSGKTFNSYGKPLMNNDEGFILCSHCPYIRKQHIISSNIKIIELKPFEQNEIYQILTETYIDYQNLDDNYHNKILEIASGNIGCAKTLALTALQLVEKNKSHILDELLSKLSSNSYSDLWHIYKYCPEDELDNLYLKVLEKYNLTII